MLLAKLPSRMTNGYESVSTAKHFILAFVMALIIYIIAYNAIENRRTRNGPWEVTFANRDGVPALIISEPRLHISNVAITFPGQSCNVTNLTVRFDPPQPVPFALPFGQCIFMDTTFQPGTLVFIEFGHAIQLLPRVLTLDKQDYAWQSGGIIALSNAAPLPLNKANISPGVP
jgi:hypothetical protein